MIAFGENKGEPDRDEIAQAQALPIAVRGKTFIQQLGNLHFPQLRQEQGRLV